MNPIKNFGKATVSTGYDASATSVALVSGHGAKLCPDPFFAFDAVWWDAKVYPDPSDDPNVEIVRVLARSTDTLTIVRGQQGTSASAKNTASSEYRMIFGPTSRLIADIQRELRARAPSGCIRLDGQTGTGADAAMGSQDIAGSAFTVVLECDIPSANPASNAGLWRFNSSNSGSNMQANSGMLLLQTDGTLQFQMLGATNPDFRRLTVNKNAVLSWGGKPVPVVVKRSVAGVVSISVDGAVESATETTGGTPPAWTNVLDVDYFTIGRYNSSGTLFTGRIYRAAVFNRELSNTEIRRWLEYETEAADQWGSMAVLNSGDLVVGKRYRILSRTDADFTTVGAASNTVGVEFTATGTGSGLLDAGDTVMRIGALADYTFDGGCGYQAQDKSDNKLHMALKGGVTWPFPRRSFSFRERVSASGNTQLNNGSVALPTNARISAIVAHAAGAVTLSIGTASAGTTIVNGAVLAAGANELTLGTRYSSNGQLWVNLSAAVAVNLTVFYDLIDA